MGSLTLLFSHSFCNRGEKFCCVSGSVGWGGGSGGLGRPIGHSSRPGLLWVPARGVRGWGRLFLRPAEVDFADARDGGDEWRIEFAREAAHFRESEFKRVSHVLARHVTGGEDKLPDGMFREGALFEQVVADALISRQQNPALSTYQGEPSLIRSSARKVSEMALEADGKPNECFMDCPGIAEVFVEVQDKIIRRRRGARVPSGWPLRFAAACSHIPRPMP